MTNPDKNRRETALPAALQGRMPTLRTIPMPSDTNVQGDIFGGWALAQMDLAGGSKAYEYVGGRVVTVGIEAMTFHKPIFVGDEVSFFTEVERVGRTSVTIRIEAWSFRRGTLEYIKVTEGLFTYVHIDDNRQPAPIGA